ncbi:MAG: hypothetical protein M3Y77_06350 [Actinomycetota bacterium]|nr:hypothetical protein [Actinomycetota bacterium]
MIHPVKGPQPGELIRRLRAWSFSSWQHGDRIAAARLAGQRLADLAADAERRPRSAVPGLSFTALADQLAVLFDDAIAAGAGDEGAALLKMLAADLGLG